MATTELRFRVELDKWGARRSALTGLHQDARKRLQKALDAIRPLVLDTLRAESPVGARRSGSSASGPRFRASWKATQTTRGDGAELLFQNTAPHAPYVFGPTRPHVIRPRSARVLAFPSGAGGGGKIVFARRVNHPGTRANDVIGRTVARVERPIRNQLSGVTRGIAADLRDAMQ